VALTVLDAGVLIAFLDATDPHHAVARAALKEAVSRRDDLVLPASAYAELMVEPYRRGLDAVETAQAALEALAVRIEPATEAVATAAAELRARHGRRFRLPDALVAATALVARADRILTTDARWPKTVVAVEVIQKRMRRSV
jgi:predicted nucleic acid-binding protein